jgi:hypothetical protein
MVRPFSCIHLSMGSAFMLVFFVFETCIHVSWLNSQVPRANRPKQMLNTQVQDTDTTSGSGVRQSANRIERSALFKSRHQRTLITPTAGNHLQGESFDYVCKKQGSQPQDWPEEATKGQQLRKPAFFHSSFSKLTSLLNDLHRLPTVPS